MSCQGCPPRRVLYRVAKQRTLCKGEKRVLTCRHKCTYTVLRYRLRPDVHPPRAYAGIPAGWVVGRYCVDYRRVSLVYSSTRLTFLPTVLRINGTPPAPRRCRSCRRGNSILNEHGGVRRPFGLWEGRLVAWVWSSGWRFEAWEGTCLGRALDATELDRCW